MRPFIYGSKPTHPERAKDARIAPHALKGQKLLAQGSALGYHERKVVAL
ncbi:hypothetical protein [Segatella copri]